jgi:hypothetical protein
MDGVTLKSEENASNASRLGVPAGHVRFDHF